MTSIYPRPSDVFGPQEPVPESPGYMDPNFTLQITCNADQLTSRVMAQLRAKRVDHTVRSPFSVSFTFSYSVFSFFLTPLYPVDPLLSDGKLQKRAIHY